MITYKNILIVKYGALGDVVRTSFFAKSLSCQLLTTKTFVRLYWLTAPQSIPLLRFNPYIDVLTSRPEDIENIYFDEIYSLDDEAEVLVQVAKFKSRKVIGATINSDGKKTYCNQSAYWFDMGLLSRFDKSKADELKRVNNRTHSNIFQDIFQVDSVDFSIYNSEAVFANVRAAMQDLCNGKVAIGLNAFAGKRWSSKALPDSEFPKILQELSKLVINGRSVHIFLLGSGADLRKNQDYLKSDAAPKNVSALITDDNVLELAAAVGLLSLLITTDSLCLHLAVGQGTPTVAFFAPTSAAEIENLPYLRKVKSLSSDYCNYRPDADNATITSERILEEVGHLLKVIDHA
jgi:heptosyltransferase-2